MFLFCIVYVYFSFFENVHVDELLLKYRKSQPSTVMVEVDMSLNEAARLKDCQTAAYQL